MITPCFYLDTHMVQEPTTVHEHLLTRKDGADVAVASFPSSSSQPLSAKPAEKSKKIFSLFREMSLFCSLFHQIYSYVYFKGCSNNFLHWAIWNNVTIVENKINDVFLETFPISLFPPDPKLWTWLFRLSFPKVTDVAFHGNPLTWILL